MPDCAQTKKSVSLLGISLVLGFLGLMTSCNSDENKPLSSQGNTPAKNSNTNNANGPKTEEGNPGEGADAAGPAPDFKIEARDNEIKVATYNVYQLFDAEHDVENGVDKEDYTFTPTGTPGKAEYCKTQSPFYRKECELTDWSEAHLAVKLQTIKTALSKQGALPDLLAIQEIENDNVARKLADVLGYPNFVMTRSPDKRGIDVALFYRDEKLRYIDHEEVVMKGGDFESKPTRNLLRVHFAVDDKKSSDASGSMILGVYVNHWPSQAATADKRFDVAKKLQSMINAQVKALKKERYYYIVMGDFNTLTDEVPNGFHLVLENPEWENSVVDVQRQSFNGKNPLKNWMPPNSYWYYAENDWNKLDRILVSQNLADSKAATRVELTTFRIVADWTLLEPLAFDPSDKNFRAGTVMKRVPNVFDPTFTKKTAQNQGYSDHLPVVVKIKLW